MNLKSYRKHKKHIPLPLLSYSVYCFQISYFREYFWERKFTVFCNNISLQYYKNLKITSVKIARLMLKLLDFDFDIVYIKDKNNKVTDALSRNAIGTINIAKIDIDNTDTSSI